VNVTVEEHYLRVDGLPIRYRSAGEGPPQVLLHGAGDKLRTGAHGYPRTRR
jgi:hypothetical protein